MSQANSLCGYEDFEPPNHLFAVEKIGRMKPLVAAVLVVFAVGAQAQTPEIDALRARAEQGYADAQYNLGFMYANGRGVLQDDMRAHISVCV